MLLLHPVGLDLTFFDALVANLQDSFAILRADANGHGGTRETEGPATLEAYTDDIHQTLVALGWLPTAVVGFSFGGMLAQTLALTYPDDVQSLVVAACASTFAPDTRAQIEERGRVAVTDGMAAVVESTLARWFSESFLHSKAVDRVRTRLLNDQPASWARAWKAIASVDTAPRLAAIHVPTLCLAGGADRSAAPAVVQAIATKIPAAEFKIIPGASHMMFIEQPDNVAAMIDRFLRSAAV